jgi:Rho-binding antiterminator
MAKMKSEYRPIDCNFYDHFEAFATQGVLCSIYYIDEHDRIQSIEDHIKTISIENKAEYLVLQSNLKIRLDSIYKINGLESPSFVGNVNGTYCSR